jgi:hypothetical protein
LNESYYYVPTADQVSWQANIPNLIGVRQIKDDIDAHLKAAFQGLHFAF